MSHQRPRKSSAKLDNPEQSKRFIEAARAAQADEDPKAFDRAFDRIDIKAVNAKKSPKKT
jgi:hypothetical protein